MYIALAVILTIIIVLISQHLGVWPVHIVAEVEEDDPRPTPQELVYKVSVKNESAQEIQASAIGIVPGFVHFLSSEGRVVLMVPNKSLLRVELK